MPKYLKDRFTNFTLAEEAKRSGYYSFFRSFESKQETEVIVKGKKVLMFGSNSYLGLTTHPLVMEAAQGGELSDLNNC